jgi:hypothetical protein
MREKDDYDDVVKKQCYPLDFLKLYLEGGIEKKDK